MKKFSWVVLSALALSLSGTSAFASDAKVVCSTAPDLAKAQFGINLSAASYAKAGYRLSAPVIRTDAKHQYVICVTAAK